MIMTLCSMPFSIMLICSMCPLSMLFFGSMRYTLRESLIHAYLAAVAPQRWSWRVRVGKARSIHVPNACLGVALVLPWR